MHTEYITPDSEIIFTAGFCPLAASTGIDAQTYDMTGEEDCFLD